VAIDISTRLTPLRPQISYKHTQKFINKREKKFKKSGVVSYPRQKKLKKNIKRVKGIRNWKIPIIP